MSEVDLIDATQLEESAVAYQTGDEGAADVVGDFVHLVVHSEFSITDGLVKVRDLATQVAELNMPAVALTYRANLFGLVKFYSSCRDLVVKALIG